MKRFFAKLTDDPHPCSRPASGGLSFRIGDVVRPLSLVTVGVASSLFPPGASVSDLLWVIAIFIFGMPHGAFDIAVVRDQWGTQGRRSAVITALIYTLLTAAAVGCFVLTPSATVVVFLFLSAHHFGVSDCVWTRGRAIRSVSDHMVGWSHGVAVLAVPFISSPEAAWSPFVKIADAGGGVTSFDPSLTRAIAASLYIGAILVQIAVSTARRADTRVIEQVGVILGATLLGLTAPPLLAIGVYFLFVHASGHCLRADARSRQARPPGLTNAIRVHWRSAPLSIPSIGIVFIIATTVFGGINVSSVALAFLLFCVIGTLPHHLLWLSAFGPLISRPNRPIPRSVDTP